MRTLCCLLIFLGTLPLVRAEEAPTTPSGDTATFEAPVRLLAAGEPVAVDAPGYACPTLVDLDGDGLRDLVVGQFKDGKMHRFLNVGTKEAPEYGEGDYVMTGDEPALVPGVW